MNEFRYVVTEEEDGKQVKNIIRRQFGFSSRLMTKVKKHECAYINGENLPGWVTAHTGDIIEVFLPGEKSDFPPEDIPIDVLFEDDTLLIINKQPGYTVHPTKGHPDNTIANGVMKYMLDRGDSYKIRFINRLDMDTTGVLVIGKDSHSQDSFMKQMKEKSTEKRYIAIVKGLFEEKKGIIELPIGRPDPEDVRRGVMEGGADSTTIYEVIEEFKEHSLLKLTIETGRTHQIRVHMAHIGHPVLSDDLYDEKDPLIPRQALHAEYLAFHHPNTGERMEVTAPLPDDMKETIKKLRNS